MPNERNFIEKSLFDFPDVFADIFNVLLFSGRQVIEPENLISGGTLSQLEIGDDHPSQEWNACKIWTKNNIRLSLLAIGTRAEQGRDIPLRVVGYDGAAYEAQVDQHLTATQLNAPGQTEPESKPWTPYPVISIVLYFGKEKWNGPKTILEYLGQNIREDLKPFVSDYKINFFDVARLDEATVSKFQSDFQIVADYFVQTRKQAGDDIPSLQNVHHAQEAMSFLRAASGNKGCSD